MKNWITQIRPRIVLRRYEAILIGSVLLLSGAVIPSSWEPPVETFRRPPVELLPPRPWIALTFDDGPHPVMTERLMGMLDQERVPATFFVVGKMADRYPQIVQEMARRGYEVANHTYNHQRLSHLGNDEVLNELAQTRNVIRRLTGHDSCLYRPPGGAYSRRIAQTASHAGYKMVLWSVLTNDVQGATPRMIYHRIMSGVNDGGIVLMHSGIKNTVDVLPLVIARLRQQGYHFVTVSTLLGLPEPGPFIPPSERAVHTASRASSRHRVVQ